MSRSSEESVMFNHSRTSSTRALTVVLPPVGCANSLPQIKQTTTVLDLPNRICSFLHFGHWILMNLLVDSRILFFILSPDHPCLNSIFLARKPPPAIMCIFLHLEHSKRKSTFLLVFLPAMRHLVIAGFEYLPWLPIPNFPRCLMRFLLPKLNGWALPLVFFLPSIILCSVCVLHVGQ